MGIKYIANIIESERGYGRKLLRNEIFNTEKERDDYIKEYNLKHNPDMFTNAPVPSYYIMAERA